MSRMVPDDEPLGFTGIRGATAAIVPLGCALGPNRVLCTADGGETWTEDQGHGNWPAPWYYLSLLLAALLLVKALDADILAPDRPLDGRARARGRPGRPRPDAAAVHDRRAAV